MIKLELLLSPPSVNTIWINKPGGRFKSEKGRKFEKEAKIEIVNQYKGKALKSRLNVKVDLYFKDKRSRDIDNYNKGILDAMTGIIYEDDSQIDKLSLSKKIGCGFNKIEIIIEEIQDKEAKLF
ncbi:MAG: RusA family crossover junction endodeoxyribonuclease [Leptotrichiaceae bacterium]|nr:RusA family crossover junction endodeoxyribonuclease [Leptotrichiaceae bacterium]MBP7739164.1 RusA family crossover junction endodeoxyribonuclease [Leptotrichiaceae bacterium]MBP9629683.1 RusA family crossover junction endodeoxyribonuclease [Leptotrichiaceae bacterium]